MSQNIVSGIIGAIIGAIALYFLLGIPGEVGELGNKVSNIEGKLDTLIALRGEVKNLKSRVETVEDEVSLLTGKSKKHGSGWTSFDPPRNFKAGDKIEIFVGGTAEKVVVRLLPKGYSADLPAGILPEIFEVPDNRLLIVQLREAHTDIIQISVHGGAKPWGKYHLGENNGSATVERVVLK